MDANSGAAVLYTYGETDETTTETEEDTYNEAWGDLLRSYSTQAITYDRIGNPETFGSRTYTWEHGRQLKSLTEGSTTWTYTYDAGGLRTGRTNGTSGGTYAYTYTGSQLTQMKKGTSNTLTFTYDASGTPLTVTHNGTKYYYTTNLQGDVVAILDVSGTEIVSYTYDAWGKCLNSYNSGIGFLNPLRYRGYVYDQETSLYYLQSRYYDPAVGRFINADAFVATGQGFTGNNMFAYCLNNPVNMVDRTGFNPGFLLASPYCLPLLVCCIAFFALTPYIAEAVSGIITDVQSIFSPPISTEYTDTQSAQPPNTLTQTAATFPAIVENATGRKPINLPSWNKLTVDLPHIISGHMPDGPRNPNGNKGVFWGLTATEILKAIKEAYNSCSKIYSNGMRILVRGYSETYGLTIEIWINIAKNIIETAYPK